MTVSITTANGSGYTWAGTTWDWTDVRAGKAWNNTFSNAYTCEEADTAPNFAASRPKDVAKAVPYETFATLDAYADASKRVDALTTDDEFDGDPGAVARLELGREVGPRAESVAARAAASRRRGRRSARTSSVKPLAGARGGATGTTSSTK